MKRPKDMEGRWRHYKGGLYDVLGVARHSETEEEMVVYVHVADGAMWVRPKAMWEEVVMVDGVKVPRFVRVEG
jgi:hypothetical protein